MGLEHEFFLITEEEYQNRIYHDRSNLLLQNSNEIVVIHDDIIQYIYDTLKWIPSINPAKNGEKGLGLNNYGVTLFDKEGAAVIIKIAKAWAELFSAGPTILKLTGSYFWVGDKGVEDGEYEILEIDRNKIVESFEKLQAFAQKVNAGNYYILHLGI